MGKGVELPAYECQLLHASASEAACTIMKQTYCNFNAHLLQDRMQTLNVYNDIALNMASALYPPFQLVWFCHLSILVALSTDPLTVTVFILTSLN